MPDRIRAARAIEEFLRAIDRSPDEHADHRETGKLVADAFIDEFCAGYRVDVPALLLREQIKLESQSSAAALASSQIILRDIPTRTVCPHHLMPASGTTSLVLLPDKTILGLGAYVQVVHAYAHRLSLQENLAEQIVSALHNALSPVYVGCRVRLSHGCLSQRGEMAHGTTVETIAVRGIESQAFIDVLR
jgi:GTP cyclohydrolase IA